MSDKALAIRQTVGVERLGEIMWKSGYWQDTRSQSQAIVKILAGAELDFGPIASMNGVYIIDGKTTLAANLVGAAIQRSERYRYRVVEHDDKHCIIDFYEIVGGKREKLGTSKFDLDDAKLAGLLGKRGGNWERYPRNMVFSRALTNGARWYTPDVFSGPIYTPDELGAEVDDTGNVVTMPYVPTDVREVQDAPRPLQPNTDLVESADERLWQRWEELRSDAHGLGIAVPRVGLPIARTQLTNMGVMLRAQIEDRREQLDREEAARAAGRAEREASQAVAAPTVAAGADAALPAPQDDPEGAVVTPPDPWARNRELQAKVYVLGHQVRDLPNGATLEDVERQNELLQAWLDTQEQ